MVADRAAREEAKVLADYWLILSLCSADVCVVAKEFAHLPSAFVCLHVAQVEAAQIELKDDQYIKFECTTGRDV